MTGGRDVRLRTAATTLLALAALGTVTYLLPGSGVIAPARPPATPIAARPGAQAQTAVPAKAGAGDAEAAKPARLDRELHERFQQAVMMLHAGKYEYAATALHKALQLSPRTPEAHVNMGYAMLGLHRNEVARDFFNTAITLRPRQANAYYGLALALEGLCDLPAAIGAMRTFIHLAAKDDPFVRKARSALWEWTGEPEVGLLPPKDAGATPSVRKNGDCGGTATAPAPGPVNDSTARTSAP